jgi:hypothetical protein
VFLVKAKLQQDQAHNSIKLNCFSKIFFGGSEEATFSRRLRRLLTKRTVAQTNKIPPPNIMRYSWRTNVTFLGGPQLSL